MYLPPGTAKPLLENNGNVNCKWYGNHDPLPGVETVGSSRGSWICCRIFLIRFRTFLSLSSRKPVAGRCLRPGVYQAPCNIRLNSALSGQDECIPQKRWLQVILSSNQ